jgi:hypothetical protein
MNNEVVTYVLQFIKPELLLLIPVCYLLGIGLKKSESFKDSKIPLILGCFGIVMSLLYVLATCETSNFKEIAICIFTAITQGILTSGCSVYIDQIIKQSKKETEAGGSDDDNIG